ncbi:MAG: FGGY family carbohydrate kinase [Candidatus Caenarcaniphilales bacterium]|nr:FGGY family carbohydrate kinase [Candidatus Caenarcaniphilales bacterium]
MDSAQKFLLAIDQGTTSCRSIIFDLDGRVKHIAQKKLGQSYPQPQWVEQDLELLWQTQLSTIKDCLKYFTPQEIASIGITNQRETIGLWDKNGKALKPAISWQCQRTKDTIQEFEKHQNFSREITGLPINPYFSATKLQWLLKNSPEFAQMIKTGEVLAGTVDTWLLYKLTKGKSFLTDYSNASRTLLFDINELEWSEKMCRIFDIPMILLPKALPSQHEFGLSDKEFTGVEIPIRAMVGDQQAALYGHACLDKGLAELTCGTGGFLLLNTGHEPAKTEGLLTSIAWENKEQKPVYMQEASILTMGSMVEWLQRINVIPKDPTAIDSLIGEASNSSTLSVMPSLTGFGSPDWTRNEKASILGLTAEVTGADILKATIDGFAFRIKQVIERLDELKELKIGGGLSRSDYFCQTLANLLRINVHRAANVEATAWGAASLSHHEFQKENLIKLWQKDRSFSPLTNKQIFADWERWKSIFER